MSKAISGSPSGITVILSFLINQETDSEEQIDIEKLKEKKRNLTKV